MSSANQGSTPLRSSALRTSSGATRRCRMGVPVCSERMLGHLVEAQRLRPGQRVGRAVTAAAGQRGDRDGGDVACVDHRHPAVSGGGADRAVADHAEQVLHEEHGPHERVGES